MESDSSSRDKPPHTKFNTKPQIPNPKQFPILKSHTLLKNGNKTFAVVPCHSGLRARRHFGRAGIFPRLFSAYICVQKNPRLRRVAEVIRRAGMQCDIGIRQTYLCTEAFSQFKRKLQLLLPEHVV
jgi:hypothetical protein